MNDEAGFSERLKKIEQLVAAVETTADPVAQAAMRELLQAVLELHAHGIARIVELAGAPILEALSRDELVSSLLLLHDLHPDDLPTRVRRALDAIAPRLAAEGCSIALTSLEAGQIRIRLERLDHGHHTSEAALRKLTEDAIWELAPDALGLEIDADIAAGRSEPVPLVKLRVPAEAESAA